LLRLGLLARRCWNAIPALVWTDAGRFRNSAAFARDHELPEQRFLQGLASAAAVPVGETGKPDQGASPIPLIFIAIGVCLTLGAG